MKRTILKTLAICLVSIMLFAMATPLVAATTGESGTSVPEDLALLNAYGLKVNNVLGNGISDAYLDNNGRLVVTAGTQANKNAYIGTNINEIAGQLTSYTLEAKLTGVVVPDGWHYGIGWNNMLNKTDRCYLTMRAGAYGTGTAGQLLCFGVSSGNNASYMGAGNFASQSAVNGTTNVFSVTVSYNETANTITYTFKMNSVEIHTYSVTPTEANLTAKHHYLNDFNIVIPQGKQVAISYMKVLDGNGSVVYNQDFSSYNEKTSAVAKYGLKISEVGNAIGLTSLKEAYVNYDDELVLTSHGASDNTYVSLPLNDSAKALEDYTLEATIKGITVSDGWHYGISWNTQTTGRAYFTMRSGAYTDGKNFGQLLCYPSAGGNTEKYLGKDIDGSAAIGSANTFKVVVAKAGTVSFYINNTLVSTVENTEAALSNFSIVVPYGQTIAVDSVAVYGSDGNAVYSNDFKDSSDSSSTVKHTLTVNYLFEDNSVAATAVTKEIPEGQYYAISSPSIDGFIPDQATVSGTMGNENITLNVTYIATRTVTVHYVSSDGKQMFKDYVIDKLVSGDTYSVESIVVANYTFDKAKVEGTIGSDNVEVTVTYTPKKYTLTVKYIYSDGTQAHEDYVGEISYKTAYSITSPAIEGYSADKATVASDSMGKDTTITVTYTKNPTPPLTDEPSNDASSTDTSSTDEPSDSGDVSDTTPQDSDNSNDSDNNNQIWIVVGVIAAVVAVAGVAAVIVIKKKRTK